MLLDVNEMYSPAEKIEQDDRNNAKWMEKHKMYEIVAKGFAFSKMV